MERNIVVNKILNNFDLEVGRDLKITLSAKEMGSLVHQVQITLVDSVVDFVDVIIDDSLNSAKHTREIDRSHIRSRLLEKGIL